jgi:hypothetical protein
LPKELNYLDGVYPILITGEDIGDKKIKDYYGQINDLNNSKLANKDLEIYLGKKLNILNFLNLELSQLNFMMEIIRHLIFFREFENLSLRNI